MLCVPSMGVSLFECEAVIEVYMSPPSAPIDAAEMQRMARVGERCRTPCHLQVSLFLTIAWLGIGVMWLPIMAMCQVPEHHRSLGAHGMSAGATSPYEGQALLHEGPQVISHRSMARLPAVGTPVETAS